MIIRQTIVQNKCVYFFRLKAHDPLKTDPPLCPYPPAEKPSFRLNQTPLSQSSPLQIIRYQYWLITFCKKRQRHQSICENIILFVELFRERASQSSYSGFISCVCPNHTRALSLLKEVSAMAWHRAKDDKFSRLVSIVAADNGSAELLDVKVGNVHLMRAGGQGCGPEWTRAWKTLFNAALMANQAWLCC